MFPPVYWNFIFFLENLEGILEIHLWYVHGIPFIHVVLDILI